MISFTEQFGPWALVTGASSGIGAEYARQLAQRKLNLVLTARRTDRLRALADAIGPCNSILTRCISADLATWNGPALLSEGTEDLPIGLLAHAAGAAVTGPFLSTHLHDHDRMLMLNCRTPIQLAQTFGKRMIKQGHGGMIFVSSIAGFGAMPGWTHYAATKAHGLLFGEGLAHELTPEGIPVQVLCPGATATEFQTCAGVHTPKEMSPTEVVGASLDRLGHQTVVIPGWHNKMIVTLGRWLSRPLNTRKGAFILKKIQKPQTAEATR